MPTSGAVYPTDSAVRAKERQKANKLAGIKPKRKPVHVEDHHDDLGDDLSGLGDDLTFLTSDIGPPDWTDNESDNEAESLVRNLTKCGIYLPCFKEVMKLPAMNSKEIELAEVSVHPSGWPLVLLSIRKHSPDQQQLNVTTTIQAQDPTDRKELIDYFKTRPVLIVVMTIPHTNAGSDTKKQFVTLLGELATAQNNSGKAFIALFEDKDDAIHDNTWRQLGQQGHIDGIICHSCQLENEKLNTYDKRPFFTVTNKTVIAKQFHHLLCDDSHRHAHHDRNSRLALCSWPTGLQQKVDMGIVDLISEGKRTMIASGTGAVSVSDSPDRVR